MTGDFYTKKKHFPGFARPFVFNAEVLLKFVISFRRTFFLDMFYFLNLLYSSCYILKNGHYASYRVGRNEEARDTARGALKLPWWTLGCKYHVCRPGSHG